MQQSKGVILNAHKRLLFNIEEKSSFFFSNLCNFEANEIVARSLSLLITLEKKKLPPKR